MTAIPQVNLLCLVLEPHSLATAARHGIGSLEALTCAFRGQPWIPETG